jgi:hypothetical protein
MQKDMSSNSLKGYNEYYEEPIDLSRRGGLRKEKTHVLVSLELPREMVVGDHKHSDLRNDSRPQPPKSTNSSADYLPETQAQQVSPTLSLNQKKLSTLGHQHNYNTRGNNSANTKAALPWSYSQDNLVRHAHRNSEVNNSARLELPTDSLSRTARHSTYTKQDSRLAIDSNERFTPVVHQSEVCNSSTNVATTSARSNEVTGYKERKLMISSESTSATKSVDDQPINSRKAMVAPDEIIRSREQDNQTASKQFDGQQEDLDLEPCSYCGRRFASDRLQKHENVCGNSKDRKAFDPKKMRWKGTEVEGYLFEKGGKPRKGDSEVERKLEEMRLARKENWKRRHGKPI